MRKSTFLLTTLVTFTIHVKAQIPNSGFENWTSFGNGMTPDDWWSTNDSLGSSSSYFPVTRSTEHYPSAVGSYSIRLESNPALSPDWAKIGVVWPGDWSGSDYPSFPVSGHPKALCGYYKYLPQNGDTMDIHWVLYSNGTELTQGKLINASTVSEWTSFKIYVSDTLYASADSARIIMSSSYLDNLFGVHGNSVLYVDNLSFDNLITSVSSNTIKNASFSLYPNPASGIVTLNIDKNSSAGAVLNIYNATGALIKTETLKAIQNQVITDDLDNGIYMLEIKSSFFVGWRKLIIQK